MPQRWCTTAPYSTACRALGREERAEGGRRAPGAEPLPRTHPDRPLPEEEAEAEGRSGGGGRCNTRCTSEFPLQRSGPDAPPVSG